MKTTVRLPHLLGTDTKVELSKVTRLLQERFSKPLVNVLDSKKKELQ